MMPEPKSADWWDGYNTRSREISDRLEAELIKRIPEAVRVALLMADARNDPRLRRSESPTPSS